MPKNDPSDINDVMREERSRGRGPVPDTGEIKAQREVAKYWRQALKNMSWSQIVTVRGLRRGSSEYEEYRQIWLAYQAYLAESSKKPRPLRP